MMRLRSRATWPTVVLAAVLVMTGGCTSDRPQGVDEGTEDPLSRLSPRAAAAVAPLTGLPLDAAVAARPAVMVPIDVAPNGPAPVGLDSADIVALEFAEGGLVRIAPVYHSRLASKVGPVAAVRPSNLKLSYQLRPYVAHDGTPRGFRDVMESAKFTDGMPQSGPAGGFAAEGGRSYADTAALAVADGRDTAPISLFQYAQLGESVSIGGVTPAKRLVVQALGHAELSWDYDAASKSWRGTVGGLPVTATNVVVLTTPYEDKFNAGLDRQIQMAEPIGEGRAQVLASGQAVVGTWFKANFLSAINILGPTKHLVRLTAGTTWVIMAPDTAKVTVS